jgi:hypothetical protein
LSSTQRLFARLSLEGLSSGDFELTLRELLGEKVPLSASKIIRLKDTWESDYRAWRERPVTDRYVYMARPTSCGPCASDPSDIV